MSKIGSLDPEIWAKSGQKVVKSVQWFRSYGQNSNGLGRYSVYYEGSVFFEKISRNMTDTEKMMMTNIIKNFVADSIVFPTEVLAHHPEELPLEIWEFTNFHWVL